MEIREARRIIGDATDQELRDIVAQLEAKDFLYLESDIERLKASKVILKSRKGA